MSKTSYFNNFPVINYNNKQAVDITERAVFSNTNLVNSNLFYPYDLASDERAEQFSNRYYSDPYKDWILYMGNNFLDPYYDWYLNDDVFQKYIIKKYGSIQVAQTKIAYFQNNWYNSSNISLSQYNSLPYTLYKYWQPIYGSSNRIQAYSRIQSDDKINTNTILSLNVSSNSYIKDEICIISLNSGAINQAQVVSNANNILYLQHIINLTSGAANSISSIVSTESNITLNVSSDTSYNLIANTLLPEETTYWSPVTYLEMEASINENNKTIQVLDSDYANKAADALRNILNN